MMGITDFCVLCGGTCRIGGVSGTCSPHCMCVCCKERRTDSKLVFHKRKPQEETQMRMKVLTSQKNLYSRLLVRENNVTPVLGTVLTEIS